MKRRNALSAGIALALVVGSASAGNDFDYCLLCHGANANGNYGIRAPKISGMEPWYLARQLENFAVGARGIAAEDAPGHEMGPVGMRLKAEGTLEAAVQFIGKLDSKRPAPTVTGDVAHGKKLYENCASLSRREGRRQRDVEFTRAGGTLGLVSRDAAGQLPEGPARRG